VQDFKKLRVWQKAHNLTLAVYRATSTFPRDESFGLTRQLRRCSGSIGANIAEGCGRNGAPELARFLAIAMGSASELEYHLLLARDLHFLNDESYGELSQGVTDVKRMLASLSRKVRLTTDN
jgi:four helix bundle protein